MKNIRFYLNLTVLIVWIIAMSFTVAMFIIVIKKYLEVETVGNLYFLGMIGVVLLIGIILSVTQLKSLLRYFTLWNIFRKKIYVGSKVSYRVVGECVSTEGKIVKVDSKRTAIVTSFHYNIGIVSLDNYSYKKIKDLKRI